MSVTITKDPVAKLDYGFDWTRYIGNSGKTIATSSWNIPTGLVNEGQSNSATGTTVLLSGGTLGKSYELINHVTFSDSTIDQRRMTILIQNKYGVL